MNAPAQDSAHALSPANDARRARVAPFYAQILSYYTAPQLQAIQLLYETAQRMLDTSGGSCCGKLLLGLYNGTRFPFDLTDLRLLDNERFEAARIVIDMDARHTYTEVHEVLNAIHADGRNVGAEFEQWAWRMRHGKHAKKSALSTDYGPKWSPAQ